MDELLGRARFEALASRALAPSKADQTEVVVIGADSSLTRFASSGIHQNVAERDVQVRVRAIVGKRAGVATTRTTGVGIATSRGVLRHGLRSHANLLTVVMDDEGSGYAELAARDVDAIDAEALGREAVDKAVRSRGAVRFEPGEYPVVLEE